MSYHIPCKNHHSDKVICLTEEELLAPMETRSHLNLSIDICVMNYRSRRGLDPMTGDSINKEEQ